MKIQTCSLSWMFNSIQNDSDKILIFDMRSILNHMRGFINHNYKNDSAIPMPLDLISDDLQISEILQDENLRQFNLISDKKVEKYQLRKRLYIFIVATQNEAVSDFCLEKIFEPDNFSEDTQALRNAVQLINILK